MRFKDKVALINAAANGIGRATATIRAAYFVDKILRGARLVLYPDAALRQQAMNTVAIESPRGFRIAKEKASRKIDAIVALAMACCAALEVPVRPIFHIY